MVNLMPKTGVQDPVSLSVVNGKAIACIKESKAAAFLQETQNLQKQNVIKALTG